MTTMTTTIRMTAAIVDTITIIHILFSVDFVNSPLEVDSSVLSEAMGGHVETGLKYVVDVVVDCTSNDVAVDEVIGTVGIGVVVVVAVNEVIGTVGVGVVVDVVVDEVIGTVLTGVVVDVVVDEVVGTGVVVDEDVGIGVVVDVVVDEDVGIGVVVDEDVGIGVVVVELYVLVDT